MPSYSYYLSTLLPYYLITIITNQKIEKEAKKGVEKKIREEAKKVKKEVFFLSIKRYLVFKSNLLVVLIGTPYYPLKNRLYYYLINILSKEIDRSRIILIIGLLSLLQQAYSRYYSRLTSIPRLYIDILYSSLVQRSYSRLRLYPLYSRQLYSEIQQYRITQALLRYSVLLKIYLSTR